MQGFQTKDYHSLFKVGIYILWINFLSDSNLNKQELSDKVLW